MMSEKKDTYFTADSAYIGRARLIFGPTEPYCDHLLINPWEIINHISLNFLTLNDEIPKGVDVLENYMDGSEQNKRDKSQKLDYPKPGGTKVEIIKKILEMYTVSEMQKKNIGGLKSITSIRKQQRFNNKGDFSFVNGLSIDLMFDDQIASNYFLLGMVIDRFFAHATPSDTFIQTTVSTKKQGKIIQWPARKGTRPLI